MKDKRAVMGLGTVKLFILMLLLVAVLGFVAIIVLNSLSDVSLISEAASGTVVSEAVTAVNETGSFVNSTIRGFRDVVFTLTDAYNATDGLIAAGNYTFNTEYGFIVLASGGDVGLNNTIWELNYTYTYTEKGGSGAILDNVSGGVGTFFGEASTWFTLLAVVVIILIISLVIIAVNRFGGESRLGSAGGETTLG